MRAAFRIALLPSLAWALACPTHFASHAAGLRSEAVPDGRTRPPALDHPLACRDPAQTRCWESAFEENFETTRLPAMAWVADTHPGTVFSDNGSYFRRQGIAPPDVAWRAHAAFGVQHWLTAESYSRDRTTPSRALLAITPDPDGSANKVLRLASPAHTDATVIRSTNALPARYRISLKVGFADFGDGKLGLNGHGGGESAGPWQAGANADATVENGFYWLAILDAPPRPHNNVWIHHHRKVVLDSDNNVHAWTQVHDGRTFVTSGRMPLMMMGIDGRGPVSEEHGKPFIPYGAGAWQPSGTARAVDSYKPLRWYRASIERDGDTFTLRVTGDFRYGGPGTAYTATIDAAARCLWHYNQTPLASDSPCVDNGHHPSLPDEAPLWPAGSAWPDYFMFGDPHNNFYEGRVYYDDIRLEVWRD